MKWRTGNKYWYSLHYLHTISHSLTDTLPLLVHCSMKHISQFYSNAWVDMKISVTIWCFMFMSILWIIRLQCLVESNLLFQSLFNECERDCDTVSVLLAGAGGCYNSCIDDSYHQLTNHSIFYNPPLLPDWAESESRIREISSLIWSKWRNIFWFSTRAARSWPLLVNFMLSRPVGDLVVQIIINHAAVESKSCWLLPHYCWFYV